jgi:hypothetical protein
VVNVPAVNVPPVNVPPSPVCGNGTCETGESSATCSSDCPLPPVAPPTRPAVLPLALDTDTDGLTDFEEIYYWYSDPAQEDTDEDGHKDGVEVAILYSPVGAEKIDSMPASAYVYPMGSLIVFSGQYYYRSYNGNYYFVAKKKTDAVFKANKFESKFAIISPVAISFSVGKNKLGTSDGKIIKPQLRTGKGSLFDL